MPTTVKPSIEERSPSIISIQDNGISGPCFLRIKFSFDAPTPNPIDVNVTLTIPDVSDYAFDNNSKTLNEGVLVSDGDIRRINFKIIRTVNNAQTKFKVKVAAIDASTTNPQFQRETSTQNWPVI